jgi:hypothetical protein
VHAATSLRALYSADIPLAGLWPSPAAHVSVEESGPIRALVMEWLKAPRRLNCVGPYKRERRDQVRSGS